MVTNRKRPERQGHVQLIDARDLFAKMRKSLGNKRNELLTDHISTITNIYEGMLESDRSKILANSAFGYRKVTVERPLRVRYELTPDALQALAETEQFGKLAPTDALALLDSLRALTGQTYKTSDELERALRPLYTR